MTTDGQLHDTPSGPLTLTFVVKEPARAPVTLDVDLERLLIGSGAHCDIRLPLEAAAYEHVVIVQEDAAIVARVVAAQGTALFDGEVRREHPLVAGTKIRIDKTEILVRDVRSREKVERKKSRLRPILASVLAGLTITAALLVFEDASAEPSQPAPKMPSPFSKATATCPEKQAALALARQKLALARSKRERFRFYPRDGVEAVALYRTANACFVAGDDDPNARAAMSESTALAQQIEEQLHGSRVILERALLRKDARTALGQVKLQRELLSVEAESDPYVTWLTIVDSKVQASISKE